MSEKIGKNALLYANGYLSFLHMVNPEQAQKIRQRHAWLNKNNEVLHTGLHEPIEKFLAYSN